MTTARPHILPAIVISQLAGGSLWFAGNAVMPDLQRSGGLPEAALGQITTAVLLGFIAGTLVYSWLAISDRYSPRRIFLFSALLGALMNAVTWWAGPNLWPLLGLRFATGFFLAGIYPVGMKIAAGWFDRDLGKALGWLVSALVMGTALPHLIRALGHTLPWQSVMLSVSVIAAFGGVLMYTLVPDGPHLRSGARFDPAAFATIFRSPDFRASAFGYFGHMWELYAFWAFVPALLAAYNALHGTEIGISLWSFAIIGIGGLGCVAGGYYSQRVGSARVAFVMLFTSGLMCLASPLLFLLPPFLFLAFLLLWGFAVVGDSPQFSTVVARTAPPHYIGTGLTIVNSIGFAITIGSIQLLNNVRDTMGNEYIFLLLLPGPLFGLYALWQLVAKGVEMRP